MRNVENKTQEKETTVIYVYHPVNLTTLVEVKKYLDCYRENFCIPDRVLLLPTSEQTATRVERHII